MTPCKLCGKPCVNLVYCHECDKKMAKEDSAFYTWWIRDSNYSRRKLRRVYHEVARAAWMARSQVRTEAP